MIEQTNGYKNEIEFSNEILETLTSEGFNTEVEVDLAFYLYVNSENNAQQAAEQLIGSGVICEVESADDEQWLCYVAASMVPSEDNLKTIGKLLINLADIYSGELDGWEVVPDFSFSLESIVDYKSMAEDVLESIAVNYQPAHEIIEVEESDFSDFNVDFYHENQRALERIGFEHISDLEDLTISAQSAIVTLIRVMAHPKSKSIVAFYYVPIIESGICEFETLLSDDKVVVSTTSPESYEIAKTPMIVREHYANGESLDELYQIHLESVTSVMSNDSAVTVKTINTFDEIVSMQNIQNSYRYEYIKSIGWVTKDYLIAQANGDEATAIAVYDAIQEILTDRNEAQNIA